MFLRNWITNEAKPTVVCALISAVSLVLSLGGWLNGFLPFDIAWIAIILCGVPIIFGAITALVKEHDIKADVLVSMALIASVIISEFFAAGEVALIMQVGSLLEQFTSGRARKGIEKLIKLTPQTAHVKRNGTESVIPSDKVKVGDILVVLAGETIPVDGVILSGETSIDQSIMTGESIPVDKKVGDSVVSGTINQYGTFEMETTKDCTDSSLQRMIQIAKEADANKAPIVGLADKWATWMVVAAVTIAIITGVVTGEIIRAVTVLVVFCPCAFILATPTAIMAGIGNATKFGILIRSGDALERLSKTQTVSFDKTGTLTYGKPIVIGYERVSNNIERENVLRYAALAEQRSEHPLGKAILSYYKDSGGIADDRVSVEILAGQGLRATIDGKVILVGKPEMFRNDIAVDKADQMAQRYYDKGATVIYISVDGRLCGLIALADTVREDAAQVIGKLKLANITSVLLTGDNASAAKAIAASVGIDTVRSGLLPEDKMAAIKEYGEQGNKVCMIGDGVNDALALSTAYAGIAMGGVGSDIAMESADAVLVSDDIKRLPYLFCTTMKVMRKVKVNIIMSLFINIIAVVLSIFGVLTPVTGALVHNFGSVFVVINAALLLRERDIY